MNTHAPPTVPSVIGSWFPLFTFYKSTIYIYLGLRCIQISTFTKKKSEWSEHNFYSIVSRKTINTLINMSMENESILKLYLYKKKCIYTYTIAIENVIVCAWKWVQCLTFGCLLLYLLRYFGKINDDILPVQIHKGKTNKQYILNRKIYTHIKHFRE